ncbi:hypothetical protein AB6D11_02680 [Vibrio splendidus]
MKTTDKSIFTVISTDTDTGQIYSDHVKTHSFNNAIRLVAIDRPSCDLVAAINGELNEGINIEFAGSSLVDSETYLELTDETQQRTGTNQESTYHVTVRYESETESEICESSMLENFSDALNQARMDGRMSTDMTAVSKELSVSILETDDTALYKDIVYAVTYTTEPLSNDEDEFAHTSVSGWIVDLGSLIETLRSTSQYTPNDIYAVLAETKIISRYLVE